MLPIVVAAIKGKRAGLKLLRDFLQRAKEQLENEEALNDSRMRTLNRTRVSRRDRMSVIRYFSLVRKAHEAQAQALSTLDRYFNRQDEAYLDLALSHYETAEKLERAKVKARAQFSSCEDDVMALAS